VDTGSVGGHQSRRYLNDRKESHNRGTIADLNYQPANSLLGSIAYQKED
jgi:hypothetical protein